MFFSRSERVAAILVAVALISGLVLLMIQRHSAGKARSELEAFLIERQLEPAGMTAAGTGGGLGAAAGLQPFPETGFGPGGQSAGQPGSVARAAEGEGGSGHSEAPAAEGLFVHVAGAVGLPGVYELPPGSRAIDAVEAAGGFASDADPHGLNLAAPLADGQWLYVPYEGEEPPVGGRDTVGSGGGAAPPGTGAYPGGPSAPVDVNRADAAGLQAIPGIGPVLAQRILHYRTENGPFPSVDDLINVKGIGAKTLEDIRPYVMVP